MYADHGDIGAVDVVSMAKTSLRYKAVSFVILKSQVMSHL